MHLGVSSVPYASECCLAMLSYSGKLRALADAYPEWSFEGGSKFTQGSMVTRPDCYLWCYIFQAATECGMHGSSKSGGVNRNHRLFRGTEHEKTLFGVEGKGNGHGQTQRFRGVKVRRLRFPPLPTLTAPEPRTNDAHDTRSHHTL